MELPAIVKFETNLGVIVQEVNYLHFVTNESIIINAKLSIVRSSDYPDVKFYESEIDKPDFRIKLTTKNGIVKYVKTFRKEEKKLLFTENLNLAENLQQKDSKEIALKLAYSRSNIEILPMGMGIEIAKENLNTGKWLKGISDTIH